MRASLCNRFGLVCISVVLLTSCSKKTMGIDDDEIATQSHGIGAFSRFDSQGPGESYTTKAPHNQTYLFGFDNSKFATKYRPSLQAQADYLSSHKNARIMLSGHTDERGSREYNVALGERRANSVQSLLRAAGVQAKQIRVVSYGKERPAVDGHDDQSYQQNRRVELIYEATQ